MIQSLNISNFQSHKDSKLVFVPGVNVIIGNSDSGKSAILRALKWVIYNAPRGDAFRSNWGGDTSISIDVDKNKVIRQKTNSDNLYILESDESMEFRAFSNDIPIEILNALNMDEINLQQQIDAPFLIKNTPGEVASHFNRMAKLEKIDIGIKNVQSKIRATNTEIQFKTEALTKTQEEFRQYAYIKEVEEIIVVLESKQSEVEKTTKLIEFLYQRIDIITSLDTQIKNISKITKAESKVNSLIEKIEKKKELTTLINNLSSIHNVIEDLEERIEVGSKFIKAEKKVSDLIKKKEKLAEMKKELAGMNGIVNNIEYVIKSIDLQEIENKELQDKFSELMPDECPLCNQKIKK